MRKQELIAAVSGEVGLSLKDTGIVIDTVFGAISTELAAFGEATMPGLGKLSLQQRAARVGRNPRTGESLAIPAKVTVKFSAAKALKDVVNA